MRERVHINIHIFICVDSCNSHNWNKCQEFGFLCLSDGKEYCLWVEWGGLKYALECRLRDVSGFLGDVRTFARKLVMGSVDLLPFAEREDLRNNSYLLLG